MIANIDMDLIKIGAKCELARRDFFYYCQLKANDFYKDDRHYLIDMCHELQEFYYNDDEVLVLTEPPRHGKSRTVGNFVEWVLGKDQTQKIMTGSYNKTLSTMFSKGVRNTIQESKADKDKIVYSDIFPGVFIKYGDSAMNLWSLEGGYNNYLATSPDGTATGFGASLMIIDDLIKSALEANNAEVLDKHWDWFTNTMLSRLEEGGKIIIIMTRWHSNDLAGRILDWCQKEHKKCKHVSMKAIVNKDTQEMLCPEILSYESAMTKKSVMGADIFSANYQQEPIDLKGRLYSSFKTYDKLPQDDKGNLLFTSIKNYTDTADKGEDYLCSIVYGVYDKEAYIIDVLYTQEGMEKTETATAQLLFKNEVNKADIESNNGGEGFARNVKKILRYTFNSNKTVIKPFHQSKNKQARILSNATWVMEHMHFPIGWNNKWPEFYDALVKYQREGKNKHDDAPDALTGVAEKINSGSGMGVFK